MTWRLWRAQQHTTATTMRPVLAIVVPVETVYGKCKFLRLSAGHCGVQRKCIRLQTCNFAFTKLTSTNIATLF